MRERFLADLIREVLGPRDGPREIVYSDPRKLYITGILAPQPEAGEVAPRDPEAEAVLPVEDVEVEAGEEDVDDRDGSVAPPFSPALDPRETPRSIGVTFAVEARGATRIEVCLSWARYMQSGPETWTRMPRVYLSGPIPLEAGGQVTRFVNASGICTPEEAEVSLHVSSRRIPGREQFMVTLHLVNRLTGRRADPQVHIFQPQIRVVSESPLASVVFGPAVTGDLETRRLEFLQRDRAVRARGHLCSAVWKEIDPERRAPEMPENPDMPPFTWPDGIFLPSDQRARFSPPDVRTEFVPVFAVETPEFGWDESYGPPPELRAEALAECWEVPALRAALTPLVEGYRRWIDGWKAEVEGFERRGDPSADVVRRVYNECVDVLRRMRTGVDILVHDEDARLAFCFACAAVDLQHRWSARQASATGFTWRPFQLGFVLTVLESIVRPESYDRDVCDLLWVPTGMGKTEAYLGLAAFTMAYRRRRAIRRREGNGAGTAVISRYTLRLLTIQQFRRALGTVTACEFLRVHRAASGRAVGWRPASCPIGEDFIWGTSRFAIGLWVGGGVTPNRLGTVYVSDGHGGRRPLHGAVDLLKGVASFSAEAGEPAQVLDCPACGCPLAVPELDAGEHTLHWVIETSDPAGVQSAVLTQSADFQVISCDVSPHSDGIHCSVQARITCSVPVPERSLDAWLTRALDGLGRLVAARPSRPGYIIRTYTVSTGREEPFDFDIFCPNRNCPLNADVLWAEGVPVDDGLLSRALLADPDLARRLRGSPPPQQYELVLPGRARPVSSPDGMAFRVVPPFVQAGRASRADLAPLFLSTSIPIPALTVDEQVYHRCPAMVISTADKFAQLSWEPRAAALFGNIDRYHPRLGYYRRGQPDDPPPASQAVARSPLDPPELILQDELHLVEGPLGSLAGLYEVAVDHLCHSSTGGRGPKYIASTATIRQAREQVGSLFARRVAIFPPHGLRWEDRFFLREREPHPLEASRPGRLYVGVCAPGLGPLTPIIRIMARLLQTSFEEERRNGPASVDPYWTLVAYFNAVRELAGARALYRQDIPEWIRGQLAGSLGARPLSDDDAHVVELSSRRKSTDLPRLLVRLESPLPDAVDALFTTSMFGTGVDVSRLNLMMVAGQPKTTSAYIQATGRVGRTRGALVVAFLRASRPRDLSHYEFFSGYHRRLYTFVEPVTVMPFSTAAIERAAGPILVAILRLRRGGTFPWYRDGTAREMRTRRMDEDWLADLLEDRAQDTYQPRQRKPPAGHVRLLASSALDRWQQCATTWSDLDYREYAIGRPPERHVVLGDTAHRGMSVFPSAPQSLRDIEDTVPVEAW